MDSLKFRVWIKKYKIMTYHVASINFDVKCVYVYLTSPEEGDPSEFSFDEVAIMQSIGFFDKDGDKIYEGDVLDNYGKIIVVKIPEIYILQQEGFVAEDVQIIGNIFENTELLEKIN